MAFLSNINRIPWKYVISMNAAALVVAFSFISVASLNRSTENRSQAKESPLPAPLTTISVIAAHPPRLINPNIDWGKVGDALVIKGENLGSTPFGTLKIGTVIVPQENIVAWEPTQIVFTIPENAITAPVSLTVQTTTGQTLNLSTSQSITITKQNRL